MGKENSYFFIFFWQNDREVPHCCPGWKDLTLMQLPLKQNKPWSVSLRKKCICLLIIYPHFFPQHNQICYPACSHRHLMSHELFIILRKRRVFLSPPSPNIWRETDWRKKKMLETYRRAHADFFEVWKRVIGFDRQWDCCDCGRNIYSGTTQHASKTITVYYSYQTLLYNSLAGEGLLTCGNCVTHQRPQRECFFFCCFFVVKWGEKNCLCV